ncbi:MAG: thioredoxin family protein [Ignavibacteria bacterium]
MIEKKSLLKEKLNNAFTYLQFKEFSEKNVRDVNPDFLNEMERAYYDYRKLNLARVSRLEKLYKPTEGALNAISNIQNYQLWLVITEDWCGDSAQTLPVIVALANLNKNIDLKILLRDSNPNLMDLYLTHGKRSIPKLVVFDKELNEIFQWGPRPLAAKSIADELNKKGIEKQEIIKQIHQWYAKDGGYSTEKEILELLNNNLKTNANHQTNAR